MQTRWLIQLFVGLLAAGLAWTGGAAAGVVINEIHFEPPEKRPLEFVELYNPGSNAVSLAGWRLDEFLFPTNASVAPGGYAVVAREPAAFEREFHFQPLGPMPGKLSHRGETVTLRDAAGKVVDEVDYGVGFPWPVAAAGGGASLERGHPSLPGNAPSSWRSAGFPVAGPVGEKRPSPGARNSVFSTNAPPAIGEVAHVPSQPRSGEPVKVTARVSAAGGVGAVTLRVQVVEPGKYIRKTSATYESAWQELPMHDDGKGGDEKAGDGVFTAQVPGEGQKHRSLVRYRITVADGAGSSVTVPYADDDCPNFAWFVYDGLPAWTGASQPGRTPALTFAPEFLGTLPSYHLLARSEDVERSQWDGGSNKRRFFGTLVYDGRVYDHIEFHNRGQASTYVAGKNKWGFNFNRAHEFRARDMLGRKYKHSWNSFSMNPCASPWAQVNRGLAGMDEAVAFRAYQLAGVPAPNTHWVNFRVIDGAEEAPAKSQYNGDEWGLYVVVQDPDGAWLREQGLPGGNIYNPETGRGHVGAGMPRNRSDWNQFSEGSRHAEPESWWRTNLNLPNYYSFHALNRLVGNIDIRPSANHCFYHPQDGLWSPVPWDLDMMFIPKTHQLGFIDQVRCLDVRALSLEYKNRGREILDLFCADAGTNGGQFGQLVDELSRALCPPGQERTWPELDQAMWNWHPRSNAKGMFYKNPCDDWRQGGGWKRTLATPDFAGFCKYLVEFCTDARPVKNYEPNDGDQRGYGFGYLSWEAKEEKIPARPTVRFTGPTGFRTNGLVFQVSPFASPKGSNQFAAVQWRVGEISAPGLSGYVAGKPRRYELEECWRSEELRQAAAEFRVPSDVCRAGRTYRVRARYLDNTGRWSHWSEAVQFVAGK